MILSRPSSLAAAFAALVLLACEGGQGRAPAAPAPAAPSAETPSATPSATAAAPDLTADAGSEKAATADAPTADAGTSAPPTDAGDPATPHGITKTGGNSYRVDRAVADAFFSDPAPFLRNVHLVPARGGDGGVAGLRVYGVKPGSWVAELGLVNGDRLETANGLPLDSPDAMTKARAGLSGADHVTLKFTRAGKGVTLDYLFR